MVEEQDLSSKVEELMTTLDQVKRYKELARSLIDFALIMLGSVAAILFVYIGTDWYQAVAGPLPSSIIMPSIGGIVLSDVQGLSAFVIFLAGLMIGIYWSGKRMNRVKVGEWRVQQKEGTLGAMKLLSGLDWPSVFQDIRYSKLGFVLYSVLKIIGFWIVASFFAYFILAIPWSYLHVQLSSDYVYIVALIIVLVLSRKDLQRRYNQPWALDSLLWELRWFDSEFRGKAGEIGTSAKA